MSTHKSLKMKNTLVGRRNVLTRMERLHEMVKASRWKEGDSMYGLPKLFIDGSGLVHVNKEQKIPTVMDAGIAQVTPTAAAPAKDDKAAAPGADKKKK